MFKEIFKKPSLMCRIAVGKLVGFAIGLMGFIALPMFWEGSTLMLQWGILLWYTTVGAVIGMFGVVTYHPVLHLPMPWWFRAPLMGGWMNFVLSLFAYDIFKTMMETAFDGYFAGMSPFWFALEGAFIGLLIGWIATKYCGEGEELISTD